MAGDERTGVSIMRVTAGLDSGPVCAQVSEPIAPRRHLRQPRRAPGAARRRAAGPDVSIAAPPVRAGRGRCHLRRQADRRRPSARPRARRRPSSSAGSGRSRRTSAPPCCWPTATGSGFGRPARPSVQRPAAGRAVARRRRSRCSAAREGPLELDVVQPAGRRAMPGADYLRGLRVASCPPLSARPCARRARARPRSRRPGHAPTRWSDACSSRARTPTARFHAEAAGLDAPRPGAGDDPRLRHRPAHAPRSTTSPGSSAAGRLSSSLDPPVARRRCGWACSSCCSSTGSPSTPPCTRASSWPSAAGAGRRARQRGPSPRDAGGPATCSPALPDETAARGGDCCTRSRPGWPSCGGASSAPTGPARCCARSTAGRVGAAGQHAASRRATRSRRSCRSRRGRCPSCRRRSCSTAPFDVHGSDLFTRGAIMAQSRASMLVARALEPASPADRVLDLCAAPGAKTTHLAALMRRRGRAGRGRAPPRPRASAEPRRWPGCRSTCARVVVADAGRAVGGQRFDAVLVDPPCSGLGHAAVAARPALAHEPGADRRDSARCRRRS